MFEKICLDIATNKGDREILIWGAWPRGQQIENILQENSLTVAGYIDKSKCGETYNNLPCFSSVVLNPEKYYIVVSLVEHDSVISALSKARYEEYKDYFYPDKKIKIVQCKQSFLDYVGNNIRGTLALDKLNSIICMSGASSLIIHDSAKIGRNVCISLAWNSTIEIGANVTLADGCKISASDSSYISIGKHSVIRKNSCVLAKDYSKISIGNHVDVGHDTEIKIKAHNSLHIGEHTLLSYYVMIRGGDGHAIINLNKKSICNAQKNVYIGDHVWICMCATLLGGSYIDSHSIVGANALVNKAFPPHVMLAGNPAHVIREQVDWHMDEYVTWEEYLKETDPTDLF